MPVVIYPNPNDGLFDVSLFSNEPGNFYIHITDISGRPVWSAMYYEAGEKQVDLSTLVSGMYLMMVENLGKTTKGKIIDQTLTV